MKMVIRLDPENKIQKIINPVMILIFNAKNNYGWKEKIEYDHNIKKFLHEDNEDKTPQQLKDEANEIADRIVRRRTAINQN